MNKSILIAAFIISFASCQEKSQRDLLTRRTWQLVQFTDSIGQISPKGNELITAVFENGEIRGSTGCNEYSAVVAISKGPLELSPQISVSERYCEGLMAQERLYLDQLRTANSFKIKGDTLEIQGRKGLLIFLDNQGDGPRELAQLFRGTLTLGNEVSDFQDCADTLLKYWVVDETDALNTAYQQLAAVEYEPIYLEMEAIKEAPLLLGYAEERDGLMRIRKILKIEKENEKNRCYSKQ